MDALAPRPTAQPDARDRLSATSARLDAATLEAVEAGLECEAAVYEARARDRRLAGSPHADAADAQALACHDLAATLRRIRLGLV